MDKRYKREKEFHRINNKLTKIRKQFGYGVEGRISHYEKTPETIFLGWDLTLYINDAKYQNDREINELLGIISNRFKMVKNSSIIKIIRSNNKNYSKTVSKLSMYMYRKYRNIDLTGSEYYYGLNKYYTEHFYNKLPSYLKVYFTEEKKVLSYFGETSTRKKYLLKISYGFQKNHIPLNHIYYKITKVKTNYIGILNSELIKKENELWDKWDNLRHKGIGDHYRDRWFEIEKKRIVKKFRKVNKSKLKQVVNMINSDDWFTYNKFETIDGYDKNKSIMEYVEEEIDAKKPNH